MELPLRAEHYGFPAGKEAASTLQDLRDWGFDVAPIGVDEEETTTRVERVYPAGTLLHVRKRVLDQSHASALTLEPRIPRTPLPGEDKHTPRVSLAPRLGGALWGIGFQSKINREDRPWDVYANAKPVAGVIPSFLDVPDKDESGEVWSLEPVPVTRIGTIGPDALWEAHKVLIELFVKHKKRRAPWTPKLQDAVWTAAEESLGHWRRVSLSRVRGRPS